MALLPHALPGEITDAKAKYGIRDGDKPLLLGGQDHREHDRNKAEKDQQVAHFLLG